MTRTALYSSLIIGLLGTFFIWQMGRLPLAIGWWYGVLMGILNYSFLIVSFRTSKEQTISFKFSKKYFFLKYVALAFAFFIILQLGQEQFGAALLGFGSYYIAMLVHYLIRLRKGNEAKQ